jgi:hypothetical protein
MRDMQRYWITDYTSDSYVIHDAVLNKNLGDGKCGTLVLDSMDEARDVVNTMLERVGV